MDTLFNSGSARRRLLNDLVSRSELPAIVAEKDLWVCWTLARLQEISGMPRLTFKGGTSLSKVHRE